LCLQPPAHGNHHRGKRHVKRGPGPFFGAASRQKPPLDLSDREDTKKNQLLGGVFGCGGKSPPEPIPFGFRLGLSAAVVILKSQGLLFQVSPESFPGWRWRWKPLVCMQDSRKTRGLRKGRKSSHPLSLVVRRLGGGKKGRKKEGEKGGKKNRAILYYTFGAGKVSQGCFL